MDHGVVAILDVLGVKGIWARDNPDKFIQKWEDVIDSLLDMKHLHNEDVTTKSIPSVSAFSDTVIVTYKGHDDATSLLFDIGLHLMPPFCQALEQGIFFRGVISKGDFKLKKNTIIGPAVDEAMSWYEHYDWIGVTLAPSASFTLDANEEHAKAMKFYRRYDVPLKNGVDKDSWVLAWPTEFDEYVTSMDISEDPRSRLLEVFSEGIIEPKDISKYKNTISFYDAVMKKNEPKIP